MVAESESFTEETPKLVVGVMVLHNPVLVVELLRNVRRLVAGKYFLVNT